MPGKLYQACEVNGIEIMHESQDKSEATNWEVCALSSLISLRKADLDLIAPPFGDGLRFNVLLRFFTGGERQRGSYKSNSAEDPFPPYIPEVVS